MGGPEQALQVLAGLQQSPPPSGEQEALQEATQKIQMAMGRIQLRSAKSAKLLSEALAKIQAAREALDTTDSSPLSPPPNLGFPGQGGGPSATPAGPSPMGM